MNVSLQALLTLKATMELNVIQQNSTNEQQKNEAEQFPV